MEELKRIIGRFVTPVIVIDGETFLGFGDNLARIRQVLRARGYLTSSSGTPPNGL